jgi:hypothetical protein
MSTNILLVFPEAKRDMAKHLRKVLEDNLLVKGSDCKVKFVRNVSAAFQSVEEQHFALIIAHCYLPPDNSPLDPKTREALLGLAFLKDLGKKEEHPPNILVAPVRDEYLINAVGDLPKCKLVQEGESFFDNVLDQAHEYLGTVSNREPVQPTFKMQEPSELQGYVDIKLHLSPGGYTPFVDTEYKMCILYKKRKEINGYVRLDWKTLKELAKKSKKMEDSRECPQWLDELKDVGESLWRELCNDYSKFKNDFNTHVQEVNGIENTRIRFLMRMVDRKEDEDLARVSEQMQAVVLEALMDDQQKFLMLQAPIYRDISLSNFEGEFPLFDRRVEEEAINCLIIEADASTDSDTKVYLKKPRKKPQEIELKELRHIKGTTGESRLLENYLKKNAPQGMIGIVTRLAQELVPENTTFTDWVFQVLEKDGPWHLVHYAGHSLVDDDGDGYVFFPGPNIPKPVKIPTFSRYLRDAEARFLYLSSCQSSKDDFVFQLASQGVPAILGFRWSIVDDKAKEFALKFYEHLFKYRSLDQAFLEARRYIHKYKDNRIWAAPMLILVG